MQTTVLANQVKPRTWMPRTKILPCRKRILNKKYIKTNLVTLLKAPGGVDEDVPSDRQGGDTMG